MSTQILPYNSQRGDDHILKRFSKRVGIIMTKIFTNQYLYYRIEGESKPVPAPIKQSLDHWRSVAQFSEETLERVKVGGV